MLTKVPAFLIGLSFFICFISIIWLVDFLIYKLNKKTSSTNLFMNMDFRIMISTLVISCIILGSFYYPQKILPDGYMIERLLIEEISFQPEGDRKTIVEDKEKINKFSKILSQYRCRRSFATGKGLDSGDISILVFGSNKGIRDYFYIVVKQNYSYKYKGNNLIYKFNTSENQLFNQIYDYVNKLNDKPIRI